MLTMIVGILSGIWLCQNTSFDWIEGVFASLKCEKLAIVGKIGFGLILFMVAFWAAKYVLIILIILVFLAMFKKK